MLRRPLFWGALYLSLVPVFAGVYLALPPRSFHQPALPLEPGWVDADGMRVQDHFRRSLDSEGLERELRRRCGYDLGTLEITGVKVVDRELRFTLDIAMRDQNQPDRFLFDDVTVGINPFDLLARSRRFGDDRITHIFWVWRIQAAQPLDVLERAGRLPIPEQSLRCEGGKVDRAPAPDGVLQTAVPPMEWLFPAHVESELVLDKEVDVVPRATSYPWFLAGENLGMIRLEPSAAEDVRTYINAMSGDPKSASGALLRMLYLSGVTVTTLGLGDITPLTAAARVAVGAESILGIVFIGLFLNAIASRGRPHRQRTGFARNHSGPGPPDPEPAAGQGNTSTTHQANGPTVEVEESERARKSQVGPLTGGPG